MSERRICEQDEQMTLLMSLALDGLVDAGGQQKLRQHLDSCTFCRSEWHAMQQVSALLAQEPMVGPPWGFASRVDRRLEKKTRARRQVFGKVAVLTGGLSLAGVTLAVVAMLVLAALAWNSLGGNPALQDGSGVLSQVASGMGLMGKGASLVLKDLLLRYGPPVLLVLLLALVCVAGIWATLLLRRPSNYRHNGYV